MSNPRIDAAFTAYSRACVQFWLMPGGPLGEGDVDHFPVSSDLFAAAFQSLPADLAGFDRTYDGLRRIVTYLADEPAGWRRLAKGHGMCSLGFLLVAAMAESRLADGGFRKRLADELKADKRAEALQSDLEGLWSELQTWIGTERRRPDSEFRGIRALKLGSYADSMVRIGTTVELTFPNREDRQTLEPVIRMLIGEPDPPVAVIIKALSKAAQQAEPLLKRAIGDFQADPFHCRGIAGCLKAIVMQRLREAANGAAHGGGATPEGNNIGLLFYRQEEGLLMPCLASANERPGFSASEYRPEGWTHFRLIHAGDLLSETKQREMGLRPEVARAFQRGSVGLKQLDGDWFLAAGRVGAASQDAILIREPPAELHGCLPACLDGWKQWSRRDNQHVSGLAAIRDQTGLLDSQANAVFTGGVRIARMGAYLRVLGFGPRAGLSNGAWWSAVPAEGGGGSGPPGPRVRC